MPPFIVKDLPIQSDHPYLAFDLEIAQVLPEGVENWKAYRPLGVTCAATLTSGELLLWYGETAEGNYAARMSQAELAPLVGYLMQAAAAGKHILTWNGLGFDFDILAEESGLLTECKGLALEHIDLMFHIFCLKGFPLALDTAAKGMGLPGKAPGMTGDLAPKYWAAGLYKQVLDYVAQDVVTTLEVARRVEREGDLRWISQRGSPQSLFLPQGWLPVKEALKLPLPDTSWMRKPWSRSKFTGWLEEG